MTYSVRAVVVVVVEADLKVFQLSVSLSAASLVKLSHGVMFRQRRQVRATCWVRKKSPNRVHSQSLFSAQASDRQRTFSDLNQWFPYCASHMSVYGPWGFDRQRSHVFPARDVGGSPKHVPARARTELLNVCCWNSTYMFVLWRHVIFAESGSLTQVRHLCQCAVLLITTDVSPSIIPSTPPADSDSKPCSPWPFDLCPGPCRPCVKYRGEQQKVI